MNYDKVKYSQTHNIEGIYNGKIIDMWGNNVCITIKFPFASVVILTNEFDDLMEDFKKAGKILGVNKRKRNLKSFLKRRANEKLLEQ